MTNVTATGHSDDVFGPWLWSVKWGVTTLSYSFPEDGEPYSYRATSDVQGLDEDQKAAVRAVLAEIASFTGLDFVEIDESDGAARDGAADLRFATEPWMGGAYAYMPTSASQGGDAFFGSATRDPVQGNEAWLYFLHEIGHSMGLEHGHEHPEFVASGLNSQEYTVVTYTDYVGDNATFSYDSGPVDWAQSYQQLDIAAMQFLYGANYAEEGELWSGDTVYGFDPETGEMSVNGIGQGVPAGNRIFRTIWDGHGQDTYDLSTYDSDLEIDLRPGAFSTFDPAQLADLDRFADLDARMARGNVANARLVDDDPRGLIENAMGGRGDDEIIGNAARNMLVGRAGNDTLWGDDGADELRGGRGTDDLRGGAGNDRLRGQQDNDLMVGGDGNDLLVGGAGDDVLIGDAGFDRLRGGDGADTFRFRSADDSLRGERLDRVLDFTSGEDRIDLTRLALEPLALELDRAPGAAGRDGPVIASAATREKGDNTVVMVDADGNGMAEMRFVLVGALGVSESDFLLQTGAGAAQRRGPRGGGRGMASVVATGSTGEVFGPWIYDYKWAGNTLSYAFPDSAADFGYTSSNTLSVLNGAQKTAVRRALEQVESFTGLSFTESGNQSGATLRFVHDSAQATASAYYPYAGEEGGDGFFGNDTRSPVTGNYDDFTFMHEIGHMLGLEHGHEAAGFAGGAYDSTEYTIMTYSAYVGDTKEYFTIGDADYAQSYQQLDIAALQFLYGANYDSSGQVWSGDSVYTFDPDTGEMSINGAGQGTPAGNRIFRTIWDGHGEDTYDLSNYTERTTIDLTPGAWSTFSSSQLSDLDTTSALPSRIAEGNVANALLYQGDTRSLIENAIGGTRQDFITGNQAANRLEGRDGRDVISGEGGKDTIYGGGHTDVLDGDDGSDFVSGGQGADLLRGGRGNDRLNGNGGNDDLRGGAGADQLRGGAGDDRLLGGTGPDRLYGQAGSDTFVFASVNDSHSDNRDRIFDFVAGVDRIDLSGVVDTPDMLIGGGARSATPSVTTVERGGDTLVLVDADGNRSIDMKIVLVGSLGLGEADFLV